MLSSKRRRIVAALATPCIAIAIAMPAAGTAAAVTSARSVTKLGTSLPAPRGAEQSVIVVLNKVDSSLSVRSHARMAATARAESPVLSELRSAKATGVKALSIVNAVTAKLAPNQIAALKKNSSVAKIVPNALIHETTPITPSSLGLFPSRPVSSKVRHTSSNDPTTPLSQACSTTTTSTSPELDPEALTNINAVGVANGTDVIGTTTINGSGVKVAYMAEGIDTTNTDFQRNSAYDGGNSANDGQPVISQVDFSGDGPSAPTTGGEAFLDASSIAAQGNNTYNLNTDYLAPSSQTTNPCYIKIVGAAPGASVVGLKVFSSDFVTTTSGFLQAIQYAVQNGVQVLNESFGSNGLPDTVQDVIRQADDNAVASGVVVVVSSGDAGSSSTIGSPATDPNVISVGATTTFRAYSQASYGGISVPGCAGSACGSYLDDNISDLSSGGYSAAGNTVDLVAPGDLNWDVCTASSSFADCTNEAGTAYAPIGLSGGTSEAAPLTSAAAADVIQAYTTASGGTAPTPAVVKQILMSTSTDIGAPAQEQGAGLLNVGAAINQAATLGYQSVNSLATPVTTSGMLVSPNQINVTQTPGTVTNKTVTIANTGSASETLEISTRELSSSPVADSTQSGSFCMQPDTSSASTTCPQNTGVMPIWSGVHEVYQVEHFTVANDVGSSSRLVFSADYQYTGQNSVLHVALFNPNGAYAGYSLPQGLADFSQTEVTDPMPGQWTAVFFTEADGATSGGLGTSGNVDWNSSVYSMQSGDAPSESLITLSSGQTTTVTIPVTSPATAGDSSESLVLSDGTQTTTVPITVRTLISTDANGGTFSGVLGGGNGRAGAPAQTNSYGFTVPSGQTSLDLDLELQNLNVGGIGVFDVVLANLIDPNGQIMATDTNSYTDSGGNFQISKWVTDEVANPMPGNWTLVVQFENPVAGTELSNTFQGYLSYGSYNGATSGANLPDASSTTLTPGKTYTYSVPFTNQGAENGNFFADPRTSGLTSMNLPSLTTTNPITLPDPSNASSEPLYIVPPESQGVTASLTSSIPVTFDGGYCEGDPDFSPGITMPGTTGSQGGDSAVLSYVEPEIPSGCWYISPAEIGPYTSAATPATASVNMSVTTQGFDSQVNSSTGDLWPYIYGQSSSYAADYIPSGSSSTISVHITPRGAPGSVHTGTLYIENQASSGYNYPYYTDADVVEAIPYEYTIGTLVQGNPKSASVSYDKGYSGHLEVSGASGAVSYTEASPNSTKVVVSSSGAISAAKTLPVGSYTVSGTESDAAGDAGTWSFTLKVNKAPQHITLTVPSTGTAGKTGHVYATASSGLKVTLSASGPCHLSGNTVSYTAAGTCRITAKQAGNSNWLAAATVTKTISVKTASVRHHKVRHHKVRHHKKA